MKPGDLVLASRDRGKMVEYGNTSQIFTHFEENSVGVVRSLEGSLVIVLLIGPNKEYAILANEIELLDTDNTGDNFSRKICNRCHVLKPVTDFDFNQTQTRNRRIRRPSCKPCRLDIDRRYISTRVRRLAKSSKPPDKSVWRCPICEKQTIVGVTAKLVLDHDHRSGLTRGYICDSCNTGLGRFRNGKVYLQNALAWLTETERDALVTWTPEERKRAGVDNKGKD